MVKYWKIDAEREVTRHMKSEDLGAPMEDPDSKKPEDLIIPYRAIFLPELPASRLPPMHPPAPLHSFFPPAIPLPELDGSRVLLSFISSVGCPIPLGVIYPHDILQLSGQCINRK